MGSYALDAASSSRLRESEDGALRRWAATITADVAGARLEEKDVSFAFHYRSSPDPWAARLALLDKVAPFAAEASGRIVEGKRVIEVVPALLPDKDAAFARLVNEHGLRGAIFMGDDGADGAVFRAIAARRHPGLEALAVAVVDPETPPSLIESAGVILDGVDAVEAFLDGLATALEAGADQGVGS
jgi:trehalose 6-phosphate phosphatase